MTAVEAAQTGLAGRLKRWRWWALGVVLVLLVAAVAVAWRLAATYQPVGFGGGSGGSYPGLPTGTGIHEVNTANYQTGQLYVPPQGTAFTLAESIQNNGPRAVTIEAVSLLAPGQVVPGVRPWPVVPAGSVHWMQEYFRGYQHRASGSSVAGLSLGPGQAIMLGIPVRLSERCYISNGWSGLDSFYVKVRYLAFTHWVAIPLPQEVTFHEPAMAGAPATCPRSP